jgi:hypothetical protein
VRSDPFFFSNATAAEGQFGVQHRLFLAREHRWRKVSLRPAVATHLLPTIMVNPGVTNYGFERCNSDSRSEVLRPLAYIIAAARTVERDTLDDSGLELSEPLFIRTCIHSTMSNNFRSQPGLIHRVTTSPDYSQPARSLRIDSSRGSGKTRVSAMAVMKLVSASQRGSTCTWRWSGTLAPPARPWFSPTFIPLGR